ncbi:VPLPA-CTERM sorting domain-containing protein [Rhodovulum sp. ES.010]|uniref:VPLPA-CTERM sorting domain-containing protein n=1 Tax=Rhodovulum sp. ES.010 TaxID=1882821 RepID=UPI0020C9FED6|nr:VPLPA-CTERM sorting domain-containing protein [Rhodovulum sp. ES.010]
MATASASTLQLDYVGQETGAKNVYFTFDGGAKAARGGEFTFDVVGTGDRLLAWCVDLAHNLVKTSTPYETAAGLLGAEAVGNLDRLFTQHYGDATDAIASAAFQVAIWELVYDSDDIDLSSGRFALRGATSGAVEDKAAEFLALSGETGGYRLTFLRSTAAPTKSQDLVTVAPVPLPAAAGFLLAGLAALGAAGRRKRG